MDSEYFKLWNCDNTGIFEILQNVQNHSRTKISQLLGIIYEKITFKKCL